MTSTIVIAGVGPGLGRSVAYRFGREGFRVALVARNRARLDAFAAELAGERIDATAYPADLADRSALGPLAVAIERDGGPVEVLHLNTQPVAGRIATPLDVDHDNLQAQLDVLLHTPVALVRRFLPAMLAAGRGGVLVSLGASAVTPLPVLANVGMAMAGLRNYVHTLHHAVARHGVYAGLLTVGGLVKDSDTERTRAAGPAPVNPAAVLDPADLADLLYRQYRDRDRIESRAGALA